MKLLVIGAGLSGLLVAEQRAKAGDELVVLEARDRVGGRLWTLRGHFAEGQSGELGAETLYAGQENVMALVRRLGLEPVACGYFDPEAPPFLEQGRPLPEAERRGITGWLRQAYAATPPAPFESLAAWSGRLAAPARVVAFLTAFAQYTPVTALRHADAGEFARQLGHGSDSFRIRGGNDLIATRLAAGLDVRLGQAVRALDWSGPGVVALTEAGERIAAERAVVTVPGPLVPALGFWPALPPETLAALAELTYGTASKVIVQYAERALLHAAVGPGCFTDGLPPWLVEQSPHQAGAAILLSLPGGDAEPGVADESLYAAFDRAAAGFAGRPVTRLGQAAHSWTRDPFARCIVRAPLGDQRERLLPWVRRPLGDRVFFAGEHSDDRKGPGGLEGATRSALRVLAELAGFQAPKA